MDAPKINNVEIFHYLKKNENWYDGNENHGVVFKGKLKTFFVFSLCLSNHIIGNPNFTTKKFSKVKHIL
jgi:hypothetical protein